LTGDIETVRGGILFRQDARPQPASPAPPTRFVDRYFLMLSSDGAAGRWSANLAPKQAPWHLFRFRSGFNGLFVGIVASLGARQGTLCPLRSGSRLRRRPGAAPAAVD